MVLRNKAAAGISHLPSKRASFAISAVFAMLAAVLITGVARGADEKPTTVRIGHASLGSLSLAMGLLMEARPELLKKYGIVGEFSDFSASPNNCITALVANQVDVCAHGMANMILAMAQGAKLRTIAASSRPQISLILSKKAAEQRRVSPDAPVAERIAALKGLSIARPPKGTTGYTTLTLLLEPSGMKFDDFSINHELFDPAAMAAGVKNGKWDAASWSSGPIEQAVIDGSAYRWITLPKDAPVVSNFPSHGLMASAAFADKNPEVVKKLNDAVKEANDLLRDRNSGAVADLRQRFFPKMAPDLFEQSIQQAIAALTESTKITPDGFDRMMKFVKSGSPAANIDKIAYETAVDPVARAPK